MTTSVKSGTDFAVRRQHFEGLRAAVQAYGFVPNRLIRIGPGYRVEGPKGPHYLKRFDHSPAEAVFLYHGLEHLRARGMADVPRLHLTADGRPFIAPNGELYYLQDWQDLTPADLDDPASLGAAAELLATLHKAGEGFEPPPELAQVRNDYGSWLDKCVDRLRELYSFAELAEDNRRQSKFDAKYAKASMFFARQAEESVRRLADLPLNEIAASEREARALCHRNFTPRNLALDSRSRLRVLDFDNSAREIRLDDLAKFIRRAGGLDLERTAFILERYSQAAGRPLEQQDLSLLAAYLLFPTEFWSIGNSRFRKDRRRERTLRRVLQDAQGWAAFADGLRDLTWPSAGLETPSSSSLPKPTPATLPIPDGPALPSVPFAVDAAPPADSLGLLRFDELERTAARMEPVVWEEPATPVTHDLHDLVELVPWYAWPADPVAWDLAPSETPLIDGTPEVAAPDYQPWPTAELEETDDDLAAGGTAVELATQRAASDADGAGVLVQDSSLETLPLESEPEIVAEAEEAEQAADDAPDLAEAESAEEPEAEQAATPAPAVTPVNKSTIVWGNWPQARPAGRSGDSVG